MYESDNTQREIDPIAQMYELFLIFDACQEQSMPRNAFSCAAAHYAFFAAVIGVEHKALERFGAPFAPPNLKKGADNGSHHVPEESVRADGELPVVFPSGYVLRLAQSVGS